MKIWSYSRSFTFHGHSCEVKVTLTQSETISSLYVDDLLVDEQSIKYIDGLVTFIHPLQTSSGFDAEVQSGYFNWWNVGVAVTENGRLVHESHPGENLRYGEALMEDLNGMKESAGEARASKWEQNKYSIYTDLALAALFFIVSKVTGDLVLAAIVGGVTGLGLIVLQRFIKVDLLGGFAVFRHHHVGYLHRFFSRFTRQLLGTNEEHGAGAIHGCPVYGRWAIETGRLFRRKTRALHAGFAASQPTCHWHEYCGDCVCKWKLFCSGKFLGRFLAYVHHVPRLPHFYCVVFCDSSMGAQV